MSSAANTYSTLKLQHKSGYGNTYTDEHDFVSIKFIYKNR